MGHCLRVQGLFLKILYLELYARCIIRENKGSPRTVLVLYIYEYSLLIGCPLKKRLINYGGRKLYVKQCGTDQRYGHIELLGELFKR